MLVRLRSPIYVFPEGVRAVTVLDSDLLLNANWIGSVRYDVTPVALTCPPLRGSGQRTSDVPSGTPMVVLHIEGDPLLELLIPTTPLRLVFPEHRREELEHLQRLFESRVLQA